MKISARGVWDIEPLFKTAADSSVVLSNPGSLRGVRGGSPTSHSSLIELGDKAGLDDVFHEISVDEKGRIDLTRLGISL